MQRSVVRFSGLASRVLVLALIFSLGLPASLMGQGGSPGADNAAAQNVDDAAASFGTQPEFGDTIRNTHAASSSAQGDSRVSVMSLNSSPLGSAGTNAFGGHDPNAKQASTLAATGGSIGDRVPQMPQDAAAQRPKAVGEALFNGLTGFMGMPGLTPQRDSNGNYDEGLGFHQDGTVRRADGNSGDQLTADGRRANAYAQSGLDGAYTNRAQTPDYDPQKWYDPHSGSQRAGNGNGYGGLSSGLGGYWTGEAAGANTAFVVSVDNGNDRLLSHVGGVLSFVCRR